jgi:hypothetical protein
MRRKMKNLLGVCATCLFLIPFSAPSVYAQSFGTAEDVARLRYLNSLYIQSYIHSDTATYDRLLWAEDFIQQAPGGALYNKKECMVGFGKPRFEQIQYFYAENIEVRFITNDVAMIHARTPNSTKNGNDISSGMSQYNDVYVRRQGKWICVSANITKISQPDKIEASK